MATWRGRLQVRLDRYGAGWTWEISASAGESGFSSKRSFAPGKANRHGASRKIRKNTGPGTGEKRRNTDTQEAVTQAGKTTMKQPQQSLPPLRNCQLTNCENCAKFVTRRAG